MHPSRIAVVGLGLIGGSLIRRFSVLGLHVSAFDADPETRAIARTEAARGDGGHRWQIKGSVEEAVAGADLVVAAVPLPALGRVLAEIASAGYDGVITDVSSVKVPAGVLADRHAPRARWIGGHPMAGSERSGFAAGDEHLFDGCAWALCLEENTPLDEWLTLASLVCRLGARVVPTTAAEHDVAVARVSHLPHIIAAALTSGAAVAPLGTLSLALGAGSFRDATRVAATRAALTTAMCTSNAAALQAEIVALQSRLTAVHDLLGEDRGGDLESFFAEAEAVRTGWPSAPSGAVTMTAHPHDLLAVGRDGGWVTDVDMSTTSVTVVRPA